MSPYQAHIRALSPDHDPRHVEAFMRDSHGTLDGLSPEQFRSEAATAAACVAEGGVDFAEKLARSFGL